MADEEIAPKKKKKGKLLKILILLILIGGAGAATYIFLWPMFMNPSPHEETTQGGKQFIHFHPAPAKQYNCFAAHFHGQPGRPARPALYQADH